MSKYVKIVSSATDLQIKCVLSSYWVKYALTGEQVYSRLLNFTNKKVIWLGSLTPFQAQATFCSS